MPGLCTNILSRTNQCLLLQVVRLVVQKLNKLRSPCFDRVFNASSHCQTSEHAEAPSSRYCSVVCFLRVTRVKSCLSSAKESSGINSTQLLRVLASKLLLFLPLLNRVGIDAYEKRSPTSQCVAAAHAVRRYAELLEAHERANFLSEV